MAPFIPILVSIGLSLFVLACLIMLVHNTGMTSIRLKKMLALMEAQAKTPRAKSRPVIPDSVLIYCEHCHSELEVTAEDFGHTLRCPECKHPQKVTP